MTEFDKEYLKLLKTILTEGVEVENRTGINTIKIPKFSFEFDLEKEFPILTTKQTYYRQAILEMLWIWQVASNDVRWLQERNVHIWDEWMVDEDGIYRIYEPVTKDYDQEKEVIVYDPLSLPVSDPEGIKHQIKPKYGPDGKVMTAKSRIPGKNIKAAKYYGPEYAYTIGTAYGYLVNRYALTQINTLETIKKDPTCRRINNSLWQNEFLRTAVLPSCVWDNQIDVTEDRLSMFVTQRSCDTPLGLPFNVTQYATLLSMIARDTNKRAAKLYYTIKDAHIYVNQLEGVKEQLARAELYEAYKKASPEDRALLKHHLEEEQNHIQDKKSKAYQANDTKLRILDIIEHPTTPELWLDPEVTDFYQFDNSKDLKHIKIKNYKHMGKITFPISQ